MEKPGSFSQGGIQARQSVICQGPCEGPVTQHKGLGQPVDEPQVDGPQRGIVRAAANLHRVALTPQM